MIRAERVVQNHLCENLGISIALAGGPPTNESVGEYSVCVGYRISVRG